MPSTKLFSLLAVFVIMPMIFVASSFTARAVSITTGPITVPAALSPLIKKQLTFSINDVTKNIKFLTNKPGVIPLSISPKNSTAVGAQFLKEYGKYFGIKNVDLEIKLLKTKIDDLGMTHLSYEQRYNGVPVYGGQMLVHLKHDLSVKSANGNIVANTVVITSAKITKPKAVTLANKIATEQLGMKSLDIGTPKLYIFNKNSLNRTEADTNYLVWEVVVKDGANGNRNFLYINAQTGQLVYRLSGVQTDNDIERFIANCGTGGCATDESMVNTTWRYEGDPNTSVADVDNLYDEVSAAHAYFKRFGLDGANKKGGISGETYSWAPATTTYGYANALLSIGCPNSLWNGENIRFCAGTVNVPVVGHEYMHAVIEFNGPSPKMPYQYESGAINEAMADIFGQALEKEVTGASSWKIGPNGRLWRNFANPRVGNLPDTFFSSNVSCVTDDYGGVHTNSMIIAHAVYMMVHGGALNNCHVDAISQDKVNKVLFRALTTYFTTNITFNEFYTDVTAACDDLYGPKNIYDQVNHDCASIQTALEAAELDQPGGHCSAFSEKTPACNLTYIVDPKKVNTNMDASNIPLNIITPPNTSTSVPKTVPTPPATVTPPTVNVPKIIQETKTLDQKPSFTFATTHDGMNATITGHIDYYGQADGCTAPRSWDPFALHWGDGVDDRPAITKGNFSATHTYKRTATEYRTSVTVINSCYSNLTKYEPESSVINR